MRLLGVLDSFGIGGAETQFAEVLARLSNQHGVNCCACSLGGRASQEVEFHSSIECTYLGKRSPADFPALVMRLRNLIGDYRPEIVYSRLPLANAVTRCASWATGRVRQHIAGIDTMPQLYATTSIRRRLAQRFYRSLERRADLLICNSRTVCEAMRRMGYPPSKLRVVPNGIDTDKFRPCLRAPRADSAVIQLMTVSSLRWEKGVDRLLRILPQLLEHGSFVLTVVGDGPERVYLASLAAELKLQRVVTFVGARSDIPDLLAQADIFVSAPHVEGFGIAVAEAQASALPVVVMDAPGGLSEIVRDGRNGYLIPSGHWDAFVERIISLSRDPAARAAVGDAGRHSILRHYSLERTVRSLMGHFRARDS
jgi:glycosyltransferase involved in cell wall biosynthesis